MEKLARMTYNPVLGLRATVLSQARTGPHEWGFYHGLGSATELEAPRWARLWAPRRPRVAGGTVGSHAQCQ